MIAFELSDEQKEIRDWVHGFAEKEIRPVAHEYDEKEEFPWPIVKKAAEVGLYGTEFLQLTSGDGTGIMPALVAGELPWGCAGIPLAIQGTGLPVAAIVSQGTPEQIATWIPACFGTPDKPALGAFAVTEPDAGSDVSSMKTRAVRQNGEWVLNGQKVFITNGGIADVHVVVAAVEPDLGTRRVRVRPPVRQGTQAVRSHFDRERGDRLHAGRYGDRDRGHSGFDLAGAVGRAERRRVHQGSGLDGQAEGGRGRGQGHRAGDP